MLALMMGVLVMTAILAGAPMYLGTIESLGLRSTLTTLSDSNRNIQIVVNQLPLTNISVTAATERVEVALEELGDLVVKVGQHSESRPHFWSLDPEEQLGGPNPDIAVLHRFDNFLENGSLVEGEVPSSEVTSYESYGAVEAVIPVVRAFELGISLGDQVWLGASSEDLPYLAVTVVGLYEPDDIESEFWLGLGSRVIEPGRPAPGARKMLPLLLSKEGLFGALTAGPASIGVNRWLVQLNPVLLEKQSPEFTANQVDAVGHELRRGLPEATAISALENPLRALGQKISFARIPTLMMGGVLLVTAVYYSVMAAGALTARRTVDSARMFARGTGRLQISGLFLGESLLLVLIPALVAPFVALGGINLIGQLEEYRPITLGSGMPVRLSVSAFAWSLSGAAAIMLYIQWVVLKGGSRTVGVDQITSRRVESKPFFQRHYLDVLFFIFGGVVLWDLSTESSVATTAESTESLAAVNPLLVFAPAIFLGVALVLSLRVLPPVAGIISKVFSHRGPVWSHLLSALFARVPNTYAWPTAILGMAIGTAMLSATVAATLQQGANDQSGYEVGSDMRVLPVDLNSGARTSVVEDVRAIDGVVGVSGGLRTTGNIRLGGQGEPFEFLAIEPKEFAQIGLFREDYAEADIGQIIQSLATDHKIEPLSLPQDSLRIGYRLRASESVRNIDANIRIIDANGLAHSVGLGEIRGSDWNVRMGRIPSLAVSPIEVVGFTFFELTPNELGTPISIQIDDLMYESSSLGTAVIESFDYGALGWNPLASSEGTDTSTRSFVYQRWIEGALTADSGLQIDLGVGTDLGVRGVVRSESEVIPIIFSESALVANDLNVGDRTVAHVFDRSIPVEIVAALDYFPTLDPGDGGFGVVALDSVWAHLSLSSANSAGVAQELFIDLDDDVDASTIAAVSEVIGGLLTVIDREEIKRSSTVTPLAVAGWRGASIVTAILAVILAVLGVLTFAVLRPAGDQFNLAVLRSLGIRKRGLVLISAIEQLVILSVGTLAGIGTGLLMARIAVDTASQTDAKVNELPPTVFSTDWLFVLGFVVVLLITSIAILVFDSIAVRRINVAVTVRTSGKSG